MSFEGLIATPFGWIMDGLYRLTSSYPLALILFAIIVQAVMVPLSVHNRHVAERKNRLKPIIAKVRMDYADDLDKQTEIITKLYDDAKISLVGSFILNIIPFFILIPIFQVVAQPITYLFHEPPETASAIVNALYKEAPELFNSSYHQITAVTHIAEYADVIKAAVPEVSARTLEGLNFTILGLDLGAVPGVYLLGQAAWAWDWAHIGVFAIPIIYMSRRIYMLIAGIVKSFIRYGKEKKAAAANGLPAPSMPNPPLLGMFFLLLSLTAMFAVPVAMDIYWLIGGVATTALNKFIYTREQKNMQPQVATVATGVAAVERQAVTEFPNNANDAAATEG